MYFYILQLSYLDIPSDIISSDHVKDRNCLGGRREFHWRTRWSLTKPVGRKDMSRYMEFREKCASRKRTKLQIWPQYEQRIGHSNWAHDDVLVSWTVNTFTSETVEDHLWSIMVWVWLLSPVVTISITLTCPTFCISSNVNKHNFGRHQYYVTLTTDCVCWCCPVSMTSTMYLRVTQKLRVVESWLLKNCE